MRVPQTQAPKQSQLSFLEEDKDESEAKIDIVDLLSEFIVPEQQLVYESPYTLQPEFDFSTPGKTHEKANDSSKLQISLTEQEDSEQVSLDQQLD